jgi:hypothetical protein
MTLLDKQQLFATLVPRLITQALALGYQATLGDAYRDPRVFGKQGERKGYGQARSAHKQRLAVDLNLFRDGKFLANTSDHAELGAYWESLHQDCVWGGQFQDGNHYSMRHGNIA